MRLDVLDDRGLNAGAGDVDAGGAVEELPADGHLERGALPAAGGIDVADVRGVLLGLRGACQRTSDRQRQAAPTSGIMDTPCSACAAGDRQVAYTVARLT